MQKIINVLAVASFAISGAIAVSGIYVYVNRDSIIDGIKSNIMESVTGGLGGLAGMGDATGGALVPDANIGSSTDAPASGLGVPSL